MLKSDYPGRCYAGWLGKTVGVRFGSCIEGWTREKIRQTYGEVTGYLQDYNDYASDDDLNGPMYFSLAMADYGLNPTAEQMGKTMLNYVPFEHSFFWWGGYGVSTEHTAYQNLRAGIPAPRSGSIAQNGRAVAEQIGGQIFCDAWGLMNPGNPRRAADYAERCASVTHDGNGIYGARFIAACIASAFEKKSIMEIIEDGLEQIPADCAYALLVRDLIAFYQARPDSWETCWDYVFTHYGYDRYPGNCHILPNSAVIILSLLYGGGDFDQTLCICNMCGWDTDCNVGNVGTIMGVFCGLEGIGKKWTAPIHDLLVGSCVLGSLNITDIPGCALFTVKCGYDLAGETYPESLREVLSGRCARYHFELPGSTHSLRSNGTVENTDATAHGGSRCAHVYGGDVSPVSASIRTYYQAEDFTDNRYQPSFSPVFYPGQTLSLWLRSGKGKNQRAFLWFRDETGKTLLAGNSVQLSDEKWTELCLTADVPPTSLIHDAGVTVDGDGAPDFYLDDMDFSGKARYEMDFSQMKMENWFYNQHEVPQCTCLRGIWTLDEGQMNGSGTSPCEAYTGDVNFTDYTFSCDFTPALGDCFRLLARVQGAERCYAVTILPGILRIEKKDGKFISLAETPFDWKNGSEIHAEITLRGDEIAACLNNTALTARDDAYSHGCVGWGLENGRIKVRKIRIS